MMDFFNFNDTDHDGTSIATIPGSTGGSTTSYSATGWFGELAVGDLLIVRSDSDPNDAAVMSVREIPLFLCFILW